MTNKMTYKLYKTRNLVSVSALIQVSEQTVNRIHDEFVRSLEGKRFSHKKFIDYLLEEIN